MEGNKPESDEVALFRERNLIRWQNRLLPLFIFLPTALMIVFIVLATRQMHQFNEIIQVKPDTTWINTIAPRVLDKDKPEQAQLRWFTLTKLEQESFYRRYNQAGYLLMSRVFTKYLGFFTGMIMAIVGSVFIIGKI